MGKLYLSLWLLGLSFLILSTACSRQSVNIDNRPCGEGCLDGYSCNDLSGLCEKNPTGCRGDDCSEPCDGDLCDCLFTEGGMEICDGLDNDCDGETDNEARDCENYYADTDGDSLGDENDYQCLCAGAAPYTIAEDPDCTTNCFDCDDSSDLCGSNCSDLDSDNIPDCRDTCISLSGDGYGEGPGCLGALCDVGGNEEPCKLYYRDTDEDTWGDKEDFLCLCAPEGEHNILVDSTCTSQECFDCNDNDFACKNDCSDLDGDDVMDCEDSCMDYDHDDYGEGLGCVDTDCNDNISTINICTDYYADRDGDGYRSTTEVQCLCAADSDYIYQGSTQVDCDDSKATSYAGATETCDGVNNDCSTPIPQNEADSDSDGWIGCTNFSSTQDTPDTISGGGDCEPSNANAYPGRAIDELDRVDNDCDGFTDDCINSCPCGDSALAACYPFENSLQDLSGNDNHLTELPFNSNGPAYNNWTPRSGYSLDLRNINYSAYRANVTNLTFSGAFTIAFWVRPAFVTDQKNDPAVGLLDNNGNYEVSIQPPLANGSPGRLRCSVSTLLAYAGNIKSTNVAHVACVFDGSRLHAYRDGAFSSTSLSTKAAIEPIPEITGFVIGSNLPSSQYLNGQIDHVLLFDRALSAPEICALADGGSECLPHRIE